MNKYLYLGLGILGIISWALASGFWSDNSKSRGLGDPEFFNREPGKIYITYEQCMILLITAVISTADVFVPAIIAGHSGPDSWLAVMLATLVGIAYVILYVNLALRFPGETVIQYSKRLFGPVLGTITGLMMFWFFFHKAVITTCYLCALMTTAFMPDTPDLVFTIIFLILSVYALYKGLEVIARTGQFLFPIGWGLLSATIIFSVGDIDLNNFLPVMGNGVKPVIRGAIDLVPFLGETVIILMILPFFNQAAKERPKRIYFGVISAMGLLGLALLSGTIIIAVFGSALTAHFTFPALQLIRLISIANFITRVDIVAMFIWATGMFIKLAIFYFGAALALSQILGLKSYRPVVVPLAIIIAYLSVTEFNNIIQLIDFFRELYPYYALIPELLIPLALLAIALIKGYKSPDSPKINPNK